MMIQEIASRYSKALFQLTQDDAKLSQWLQQLTEIERIFAQNAKLSDFINSPLVKLESKYAVLEKLFKDKLDADLYFFLRSLTEKDRFRYLKEILEKFAKRVNEKIHLLDVQIISTEPLDQETKEQLQAKIENHYHKKVQFIETIDSKIIGGLILIINNQMLDLSIRGKLQRLKESLLT